jgi:hypothetical protein
MQEHRNEAEVKRDELVDFLLAHLDRPAVPKSSTRRDRNMSISSVDAHSSRTLDDNIAMPGNNHSSGGLTQLNVVVINPPRLGHKMKANKNQIIIDKAKKAIVPFLEQFSAPGSSSLGAQRPDVLALDLRSTVLRKLVECHDILEDDFFKKEVVDYFPQLKDYLFNIRSK